MDSLAVIILGGILLSFAKSTVSESDTSKKELNFGLNLNY
jgi:hypothetical protein